MSTARALAGALLALHACGDPAPVAIGLVASVEGAAGARFAAAEINRNGGIRGRPLVLRAIGGGSTQARAALVAAESLSTDPAIIAVVGHSNSTASLAGAQIYNARRVVQVAPTSSSAQLSGVGPYTFRLVASDVHQAGFLAQTLIARGIGSVAVFYVNDDYGRSLHANLHARLVEAGVTVAVETPYFEADSLPGIDATAATIARNDVRDVVWLGRSAQLAAALPPLRKHIPGLRVLASDGVDGRQSTANLDGRFTGVQYVCFVDITGDRPELAGLRKRYRARTGHDVTVELALTYDAVRLLAAAAESSGPNRRAIFRHLRSLGRDRPPLRGATGDIAFDDDGDPRPTYCLAEIVDDGVRMIATREAQ